MRILIVATYLRNMMPFIDQYENILKKNKVKYDILFWDRFSTKSLEKKGNEFIFHQKCSLGGNKLQKIYPYYLFRKNIKKILKNNIYEKIIVFNTLPAFFISDILLNDFSGRYILDIRDYTYEKYSFYRNRILKLIDKSFFTGISSLGFKRFLGDNEKLIVNHNMPENYTEISICKNYKLSKVLRLGYIGTIRYFYENTFLIQMLANDKRFELIYAGRSYDDCNLQRFCEENKINNVKFLGEFQNSEKKIIYEGVDLINAVYGNQSLEVTTALPNRFYDALILKKPMVVSSGTYLANLVESNDIGIAIEIGENDIKRKIIDYISKFDHEKFSETASNLLRKIENEQKKFHKYIEYFLKI